MAFYLGKLKFGLFPCLPTTDVHEMTASPRDSFWKGLSDKPLPNELHKPIP